LLGTRIALMESGQLVTILTPEEFLHSTDPMVAAYVDAFKTELSPRESRGHL
jgi:ABC-type proline/glycine betaine transport system ATPase subunit